MSGLTTINGNRYYLPGILRGLDAEAANTLSGSARAQIEMIARLLRDYDAENAALRRYRDDMHDTFARLAALVGSATGADELLRKVEALRKDAERLQWLADNPHGAQVVVDGRHWIVCSGASCARTCLTESARAALGKSRGLKGV